jgi:hypothetical protein
MTTFEEINDSTGFANGARFESADEVREYFTVENMVRVFGTESCEFDGDNLEAWAATVISRRWHCAF